MRQGLLLSQPLFPFYRKGKFGELLRCCIGVYTRITPMQPPRISSKFPLSEVASNLLQREKETRTRVLCLSLRRVLHPKSLFPRLV